MGKGVGGEMRIRPGSTECMQSAGYATNMWLTKACYYNASFMSVFKY